MAESNIIQMHDYAGNNQYPVTLASLVYDEDGETVSKKLALLLDWFEWGDEEETSVKTKYPFWSEKQLSAGGIGEEGEGGGGGIGTITGIYVNGVPYNEPDEFGMLTLPNYPTSLEWANINGKPTHLSQFTDDVVAGKYLPLTGGTMQGSIDLGANCVYSNGVEAFRSFSGADTYVYATQTLYLFSPNIISYRNSVGYRVLDEGNIGEYAARSYSDVGANNVKGNALGYSYATAEHGGRYAGGFISFGISTYGCQLQGDADGNGLVFRGYSPSGFTPWKTIAFIDSNVASATKLATPRTIWGQPFDGTGNVDGDLSGFTSLIMYGSTYGIYKGSNFSSLPPENALIYYATSHYFHCDNGSYSMILNSSGNVTIGSSDLAGTDAKLYVDGSVYVGNAKVLDRVSKNLHIGEGIRDAFDTSIFGTNILFNTTSGDRAMMIAIGGNILIGTTVDEGYKLDVRGSTHLDAYDGVSYVHIGPLAFGTKIQARGDGNTYFQSQRFDDTTVYYNIILQELGGNVGIGTSSPDEMLHVAGNIRLKNTTNFGCFLKFGDYNNCYLYEDSDDHLKIYARAGILLSTNFGYGVTIDKSLTIGSAVLSWDSTNNALKIEGNVYTTGQLSAGGVGTEVQKVFDIAAVSDATTANQPYTATLTHNLNTYDLAVVVYEVEEITQSGVTTEKLTQVLADVTLTDENNVMVYFASRKINRKYRIVIIG